MEITRENAPRLFKRGLITFTELEAAVGPFDDTIHALWAQLKDVHATMHAAWNGTLTRTEAEGEMRRLNPIEEELSNVLHFAIAHHVAEQVHNNGGA